MMLDSDTAGQWCCDLKAAAAIVEGFSSHELAERLMQMAETIADQ